MWIFFSGISAFAQGSDNPDSLGIVKIIDVGNVKSNILEFALNIHRSSNRWVKWVNGTFIINSSDPQFKLDTSNFFIEFSADTSLSELKKFRVAGGLPDSGDVPTRDYLITQKFFKDKLSINVVGPRDYNDCDSVMYDHDIKIGKFRLISKDGSYIPPRIEFSKPYNYYQACAFKLGYDSVDEKNGRYYSANDNLEMIDHERVKVDFHIDTLVQKMELISFVAEYTHEKKDTLYWETLSEKENKGFIVRRGVKSKYSNTDKIYYNDVVADYRNSTKPKEKALEGKGSTSTGFKYEFHYDSVPFRGVRYYYLLQYQDFAGNIHDLAWDTVDVPHAAIVKATPEQNPFFDKTKIFYRVDDDVYLTIKVFDIVGNEISTIIDRVRKNRGEYEFTYESPRLASQGIYEMVFIANPIEDPTIEISRATINLQLLK